MVRNSGMIALFLHDSHNKSRLIAGYANIFRMVGGTVGAPVVGYIHDKVLNSNCMIAFVPALASVCVVLLNFTPHYDLFLMINCALLGILCAGTEAMILGGVASKMGTNIKSKTGIALVLNGTCMIGTAVSQGVIGVMITTLGWDSYIAVMSTLAFFSSFAYWAVPKEGAKHDETESPLLSECSSGPPSTTSGME